MAATARDFWTDAYRSGLRSAPADAPRSADAYAHTLADTMTIRSYGFTRPQLDELYRVEKGL